MTREKPIEVTFIDPLSDFGFKKICGEEHEQDEKNSCVFTKVNI
jgi:hypothetical protein